ncbi:hypothetical protein AXG93_2931s1490 [Marchantia polymorpha subsp. ruderalis]|uniref:Uncharacterized protein n=1 Tax=Marchantia polymorpha subsp. ruderalis TaxID=1480154 RepID=A0A176VYE7_MARPO|nr:hypothetical protein AXG93_2931s1490 [Marchantia polymorpha subsp. ruderalis]
MSPVWEEKLSSDSRCSRGLKTTHDVGPNHQSTCTEELLEPFAEQWVADEALASSRARALCLFYDDVFSETHWLHPLQPQGVFEMADDPRRATNITILTGVFGVGLVLDVTTGYRAGQGKARQGEARDKARVELSSSDVFEVPGPCIRRPERANGALSSFTAGGLYLEPGMEPRGKVPARHRLPKVDPRCLEPRVRVSPPKLRRITPALPVPPVGQDGLRRDPHPPSWSQPEAEQSLELTSERAYVAEG